MSCKPSGEMEQDRPDPLPGFLASPPGSTATFDRPEGRLDLYYYRPRPLIHNMQ